MVISLPKIPCNHTVYDRMYGDPPAKATVYILYVPINVWFWPTLNMSHDTGFDMSLICFSSIYECLYGTAHSLLFRCWMPTSLRPPIERSLHLLALAFWKHTIRIVHNRMYTPYLTVFLVISLPKIPYTHRIYMALVNSTYHTHAELMPVHTCVPVLACNDLTPIWSMHAWFDINLIAAYLSLHATIWHRSDRCMPDLTSIWSLHAWFDIDLIVACLIWHRSDRCMPDLTSTWSLHACLCMQQFDINLKFTQIAETSQMRNGCMRAFFESS